MGPTAWLPCGFTFIPNISYLEYRNLVRIVLGALELTATRLPSASGELDPVCRVECDDRLEFERVGLGIL